MVLHSMSIEIPKADDSINDTSSEKMSDYRCYNILQKQLQGNPSKKLKEEYKTSMGFWSKSSLTLLTRMCLEHYLTLVQLACNYVVTKVHRTW
jgi:uncharacterized protein (DUF927 family)